MNGGAPGTLEWFYHFSFQHVPEEEPARDFRILPTMEALEVMTEMWEEKVKWVSKVTPRILGALSSGMMKLSMEIWG